MTQRIVVLSGVIGAGKSTLANGLEKTYGARVVKTRELLDIEARHRLRILHTREEYQEFGELRDIETGGAWVANALAEITRREDRPLFVVDSIRIPSQMSAIRKEYKYSAFHLHLTALKGDLEERFKKRASQFQEAPTYADARSNATEARVPNLEAIADAVTNTSRSNEADVLVRAATHLRLLSRDSVQTVDVIVGGQFGSEGKGHISSYISKEYKLLIRGGGPNAGHKVFEEPKAYTHHQLPSGTRTSKADLLVAAGAVINADKLLREIQECQVTPQRLSIDPLSMVISSDDIAAEETLVRKIGSTGQGVGMATARRIRERGSSTSLAKDIPSLSPYIRESGTILERAYQNGDKILVEGTQGAGLSLFHGHYPYVTSRDTTVSACLSEAGIPPRRVRKILMTCRTYPIRVDNGVEGTSGPLSKEISWEDISDRSGISIDTLRGAERTSTTDRQRRVSEFDWVQLRRAAQINGPTDIALTFADYLAAANRKARRFEQLPDETIQFIEEVENVAGASVSLISTYFGYRSIIDRRNW